LRDRVLEMRNVDGRLHIAARGAQAVALRDHWDPYVPPHDPYKAGAHVIDDAGDQFTED
jgi:hypothetical protein